MSCATAIMWVYCSVVYWEREREGGGEDGSVYEPKNIARNTTNTSNKLRVVYVYIIL
jgi:hypothetical protein